MSSDIDDLLLRAIKLMAFAVCLPGLVFASPTSNRVDLAASDAVLTDIQSVLTEHGARYPGAPGSKALADYVAKRFAASGFKTGAISFSAPVFEPGPASMIVGDSTKPIPLQTMHPTLMRPGNLPESPLATRLVYMGKGSYDDLERVKGIDLDGCVALMEFDCGDRWTTLLRFGVTGFIFLSSDAYAHMDSQAKIYGTEVAVPRFFVDSEHMAGVLTALKKDRHLPVTITSKPSTWRPAVLKDLWVFIPGSDPGLSREVITFTAALDANSVVPERAMGGQSIGNLCVLLSLLDALKTNTPSHSVLLAAVDAHTQKYRGERMLAWHMRAPVDAVETVRDNLARDMRIDRLYVDNYSKLALAPVSLAAVISDAGASRSPQIAGLPARNIPAFSLAIFSRSAPSQSW